LCLRPARSTVSAMQLFHQREQCARHVPRSGERDAFPAPQPRLLVFRRVAWPPRAADALSGRFRLTRAALMLDGFRVIGSVHHGWEGEFAGEVRVALGAHTRDNLSPEDWSVFAERLSCVASSPRDGGELAAAVVRARRELGESSRRLLYLSVFRCATPSMVGSRRPDEALTLEAPVGWRLPEHG
jgi:hypothetical protein